MAKCKGSNEDGSVCGRPSMYKSDYCKRHRDQDPSVSICIGKNGNGRPCFREAMVGALFCRGHRTQLGDIEKLQCPRGCGQLTYRMEYKNGYYACQKCKGTMLDAKSVEDKLSKHAETLKDLLENGNKCSLKCPRCEALMLEIRVAYKLPEGGGSGGMIGGDFGGAGAAGLLLGIAVIAVVASAAESSKSKKGKLMVIDGCRDCGTFWFDAKEMNTVKQSTLVEGEEVKIARMKAENTEKKKAKKKAHGVGLLVGRAANTNCLHIEEKNGKKCRRVTFRASEYCYKHQPK